MRVESKEGEPRAVANKSVTRELAGHRVGGWCLSAAKTRSCPSTCPCLCRSLAAAVLPLHSCSGDGSCSLGASLIRGFWRRSGLLPSSHLPPFFHSSSLSLSVAGSMPCLLTVTLDGCRSTCCRSLSSSRDCELGAASSPGCTAAACLLGDEPRLVVIAV